MKITRVLFLTTAMLAVAAIRAEAAMEGEFPPEAYEAFKRFLMDRAISSHAVPSVPGLHVRIRERAREIGIPDELYIAAITNVASDLVADTVVSTNDLGKTRTVFRRGLGVSTYINIMGMLGDPRLLPWLEGYATAPAIKGSAQESAAQSYVKIAGIDATLFVERILSGDDDFYGFNCKYLVAREFFAQIERAEAGSAPREKLDAAYTMLVRQAQTISQRSGAWELDDMLVKAMPDYKTSIQRERALERHRDETNEVARAHFLKESSLLQQMSKDQRTDLRMRFPGLAEPTAPDGGEETEGKTTK